MVRSIFALAVLSVASVSLAGNLVTPPLFVGASSTAACRLANITSAPIPAQLELWEAGGDILATSGPVTMLPNKAAAIGYPGPQVYVYCRFVNASKSKVRASLTAYVTAGDGTDLVAVSAQ